MNPKRTALYRETPLCGQRSVGGVQVSPVFVFYLLLFRLKHYRIHSVTKNTSSLSISIPQLETSNFQCPQWEVPTFTRQSMTVLLDESNKITLWCGCHTILLNANIVLVNEGRGCYVMSHDCKKQGEALTLRRLMSYIYMEHPFLMFLDHTQRRSTVGRTPLDE